MAETMTDPFEITRVFDAPRERVWRAFTEAKHLVNWWGPKGFQLHVAALDLRPGGTLHYRMTAPNGHLMWGKFVYREIAPPERMVFVVSFTDDTLTPVRHPMSATWPLEVVNTLTLTEEAGKTTLTLSGGPINATEEEVVTFLGGRESMQKGFDETFDNLEQYLAGEAW